MFDSIDVCESTGDNVINKCSKLCKGYINGRLKFLYSLLNSVYLFIDPLSGKKIPVVRDYHEKQLCRALLQYSRPQNADLVREALTLVGREDLIGFAPECLVRPARGATPPPIRPTAKGKGSPKSTGKRTKSAPNTGIQYNGARRKKGEGATPAPAKSARSAANHARPTANPTRPAANHAAKAKKTAFAPAKPPKKNKRSRG